MRLRSAGRTRREPRRQCTQSRVHILAIVARVLIVTSERIDDSPAGPGLRALGLAQGLRANGIDAACAAPVTPGAIDGVPVLPLSGLAAEILQVEAAIVPAALVHAYPEVLDAGNLCVDFAGPFPLEAQARGADSATVRKAEKAAVFAVANADLILCAHERQRVYTNDLLARHGRSPAELERRVALVPFGITPCETPTQRSNDGLRLVWPGGLWDWLDPLIALTALAHLRDDVTIEYWGTQNPDPQAPRMRSAIELAARVRDAHLDDRVRLVEWVPRDEFDRRLASFDLAVTFDSGGDEAQHAFRTRLLHALAGGVPTIATRGEFVADLAASHGAGWTIAPGDATGLVDLLEGLRTDHDALRRASDNARKLAAGFTYPRLVEPIANWLDDEDRFRLASRDRPSVRSRVRRMLRKSGG